MLLIKLIHKIVSNEVLFMMRASMSITIERNQRKKDKERQKERKRKREIKKKIPGDKMSLTCEEVELGYRAYVCVQVSKIWPKNNC